MRCRPLPVILSPGEDGFILAACPAIPGCLTQGKTRAEALANLAEVIAMCLENREAEGWRLQKKNL